MVAESPPGGDGLASFPTAVRPQLVDDAGEALEQLGTPPSQDSTQRRWRTARRPGARETKDARSGTERACNFGGPLSSKRNHKLPKPQTARSHRITSDLPEPRFPEALDA